jgi:hypothetical protein
MSYTRGCNRKSNISGMGWMGALALALALAGGCKRSELSGAEQSAPLVLEVAPADLDAEVFVDGNYVGQVKVLQEPETGPLLLAPGIHRIEVRKPGRFPVQVTATVKKDRNGPVVIRAELLEDPS